MELSIDFQKPEIKGSYDWQLIQEINVSLPNGDVIAKAEIELVTLNKHRDANKSYDLLDQQEATDWEIPFGVYFKKQNLIQEYCDKLGVAPDTNAKTHIMIEALSVHPAHRKQGVAKQLLQSIAEHYPKAQSINVMSMPMNLFVDLAYCNGPDNTKYYESLNLAEETIANNDLDVFWEKSGFMPITIDEKLLAEPLSYHIFLSSPSSILTSNEK